MEKSLILERLSKFISKDILDQPDTEIAPQEQLLSTGLIDSFSLVDLSIYIETEFSVRIDDTELNSSFFDSLDELADLIISRK